MVSLYRASQIAGVHKSSITRQCKKMPLPPYVFKLADGNYVIDEKSIGFKEYCKKIKKRNGAKTVAKDKFKKLLQAVFDTLNDKLDLDDLEMDIILKEIDRRYNE